MEIDALTFYRLGRRLRSLGIPVLPAVVRRVSYYLHNSYVPEDCEIGEGTFLGYGGIGVVIHKESKIGRHCLISQQVTLGGRSGLAGAPVLGDYVRIGAGAKLLGPITIGDFAVIGANSVVTQDVAPGTVVAGVPARELRKLKNPAEQYRKEMGSLPGHPVLEPESPPPVLTH